MWRILYFRSSKNHRCNWQLNKPASHKFLSLSVAINQFEVLELPYTHEFDLQGSELANETLYCMNSCAPRTGAETDKIQLFYNKSQFL